MPASVRREASEDQPGVYHFRTETSELIIVPIQRWEPDGVVLRQEHRRTSRIVFTERHLISEVFKVKKKEILAESPEAQKGLIIQAGRALQRDQERFYLISYENSS